MRACGADRLAFGSAQYIAEQKARGLPRIDDGSETASSIARLVAIDAEVAQLNAQRRKLIARVRVLTNDYLSGDQPYPTAVPTSAVVLPFAKPATAFRG